MAILPIRRSEKNELARLHQGMDDLFSTFFGDLPSTWTQRQVWPLWTSLKQKTTLP